MTPLAALALVASALPALAQGRLEVGWISLEPRLPPPNRLDAPAGEGWPLEGDRVQWVAHLLNRGSETAAAVPYTWTIDDGTSRGGEIDLPPGESTVWLSWSWTFERREVSFRIDPPPETGDANREDDSLTVISDALSLALGVEQDVYDWLLEDDGPGFERLMQQQVAHWNGILARAVHPSAPEGALDRIRLDLVRLFPDGSGANHGEFSTDLRWFFPAERRDGDRRFLHRAMDLRYREDQTIVLHELMHQRGLIDLYAYAVFHGDTAFTDSRVDIAENGRPVAGTELMPPLSPRSSTLTLYALPDDGLMGTRIRKGTRLTEHSAFGLNLLAERRTPRWLDRWGNQISLGNGVQPESYVARIPERTELCLVDQNGSPVPNAAVDVYLDHSPHAYQNLYGPAPDRTLSADPGGIAVLPGDLLDALPFKSSAPPKAMVVILGVRTARARGYAFLPVYDLNLLHFRGHDERAELELELELHPW